MAGSVCHETGSEMCYLYQYGGLSCTVQVISNLEGFLEAGTINMR